MRYLALCCDYDGTLAHHGRVAPETFSALERLKASGRRVILVTGRELPDLRGVCPRLEVFDHVVAENGALLYEPGTQRETPLAARPPESFIASLRQRGVSPISEGRVIVATWEPHGTAVLEVIRESGLPLQVIPNKGAVMVLPTGISKASGLAAALERIGLSAHNTVGIGDAENDHALLDMCECSAAVANALPSIKSRADIVTAADHGAGVIELCEELLRDDLAGREPRLLRHNILIGLDEAGHEIRVAPYGERILVLAAEHSTSALVTRLLEQLSRKAYTFCALSLQTRQAGLAGAVSLGEPDRAPGVEEILQVLKGPGGESVLVSLAGLTPAAGPDFLSRLASGLEQLRAVSGKPHWLLIDATDASVPAHQSEALRTFEAAHTLVCTTQHPDVLSREALQATTLLVANGAMAHESIAAFCRAAALALPSMGPMMLADADALAWRPGAGERPRQLTSPAAHSTPYAPAHR